MVLIIGASSLNALVAHAASTYPYECCGLLLGHCQGDRRIVAAPRAMVNAWDDVVASEIGVDRSHGLADRYWIDPAAMLAVMREARNQSQEIVGVYHSHPDHWAVPSEYDRQLAWSCYAYLIISVMQGQVRNIQTWSLNEQHQFQPEPMQVIDSSLPDTEQVTSLNRSLC